METLPFWMIVAGLAWTLYGGDIKRAVRRRARCGESIAAACRRHPCNY